MKATHPDTAKLRELLAAATPLPWRDMHTGSEGAIVLAGGNTIRTALKPATCRELADAELIAAAITALPALLDELDAHRHQVDRLTVDHEHDQRTIHDLEQRLRVAREDLAAAVATDGGTTYLPVANTCTACPPTPRTASTTDARKRLAEKQGGAA